MKTLYLECNSGICGDMTVAALLDLGADKDELQKVIDEMNLGCRLHFNKVQRSAITAGSFSVELPDGHIDGVTDISSHEHDSCHYYDDHLADGHEHHSHDHADKHVHHCHDHAEEHEHHGHDHHHIHRNLADVCKIIDTCGLSENAKNKAKKVFEIVAEAEAGVHGKPIDEVHFHEVGAIDSIVDICAAAFCIDNLGVEKVIVSPLSEGHGTVQCAHGLMPVPAPATAAICSAYNIPLNLTDNEGEMVTPTGAAIAAAYADRFGSVGSACVKKIGYGAGKRQFKYAPNILRAMIVETDEEEYSDSIICIETNIDDCSSEQLGYCLEMLFKCGVKDAWFTPIFMKKNRPAYSLSVMCKPEVKDEAVKIIFENTSSVGMRISTEDRIIMKREPVTVETPYGPADAKKCTYGNIEKITIEYESAKRLAIENGVSIASIYQSVHE